MRRLLATLCAALAIGLALGPALALGDTLSLEQQLKCPTCDVPLNMSNAPSALAIKAYIEQKEAAGWSDSRITDSLVQQFGRDILATPPKSGFDLIVWLVPAALIVAGLIALPFVVGMWMRQRRTPADAAVTATPEELARLEQELRTGDG
jgi:cytochrome c-type biogenesis protein CcmH